MPSDKFFEEIDPIEYYWLFFNWQKKEEERISLLRNLGILIGSFTNPEAAKKMANTEPTVSSSDEDLEKSWEMVQNQKQIEILEKQEEIKNIKHRRKRKIQKIM